VIDPVWLVVFLLPVAAASGWLAARWDQRDRSARGKYDLPAAYFKGLNFLLNEQPDKAIEVFVKVLEVDSETVETHLAVGNLFRRRGEIERATRIHQNLIARPNLDRGQRSQALFELAQDYFKAGLFDRAESLFQELAEVHQHSDQALRALVHIYEQEKEWEKAIAASRKLSRISGQKLDPVIAHYACELAEQAQRDGDSVLAEAMARRALNIDRNCVRATLILGQLHARAGNHKEAVRVWRRVGEQDPAFLVEAVSNISASYRALGDEDALYEFLNQALQRHGGDGLMLSLARMIETREGLRAAQDFVVDWLRRRPTVLGLYRLIELNLGQASSDAAAQDLRLLLGLIGKLSEEHQGYTCTQCGFRGKQLHWQCPGCKGWNTIRPGPGEYHAAA